MDWIKESTYIRAKVLEQSLIYISIINIFSCFFIQNYVMFGLALDLANVGNATVTFL